MDHFEAVVLDYLRADRATFINAQCCIQLNPGNNPDNSGPHWYCDAVAVNFRERSVFLCEISYGRQLTSLMKRLGEWHAHWDGVSGALARDSLMQVGWPVRPWLFVPEDLVPLLTKRLAQIAGPQPLAFVPRITTLEMVQPWRYTSWNRLAEAPKPAAIPEAMRI